MCTSKMKMLKFTMLGAHEMNLSIQAGVGEAIPTLEVYKVGDMVESLVDYSRVYPSWTFQRHPIMGNPGIPWKSGNARNQWEQGGSGQGPTPLM